MDEPKGHVCSLLDAKDCWSLEVIDYVLRVSVVAQALHDLGKLEDTFATIWVIPMLQLHDWGPQEKGICLHLQTEC